MTIFFSEEELQWIEKEPFNWHVKKDCPKELLKQIQNKLNALNEKHSNK